MWTIDHSLLPCSCPPCRANPTDFKSCIFHLERETTRREVKIVGETNDDGLEEFRSLTVPQLKAELRERNLPLSGRKEELVARLANWLQHKHDLGEVIEEEEVGDEIESCEI